MYSNSIVSHRLIQLQITLPSIVESEEGRKGLSTVLQFSRQRYRQFRSKLSQEIQENKGKHVCTACVCLRLKHIVWADVLLTV